MQDPPGTLGRFDHALWEGFAEGSLAPDLPTAVAAVGLDTSEHLTVETVIGESGNPLEFLRPRTQATIQYGPNQTTALLRVQDRRWGDFVLGAWPTAHQNIYQLTASVPVTDPRWDKVTRWISNTTNVTPCFLNQEQFYQIANATSSIGEAAVSRLTARKFADWSSISRGWNAGLAAIRPTPQQAIDEIEQSQASVRTMTIQVDRRLSIHLRRLAGATFYAGKFDIFERVILRSLADAANQRRELFNDRQRRVENSAESPISIYLQGSILKDSSGTGEVVSALADQSDVNIAVLHRNPYLHVVVTDHKDGSNFDVFVTDPATIEIFPGYRASIGALTRLSQHLSDRFSAVDIGDSRQEDVVSLDDLVMNG